MGLFTTATAVLALSAGIQAQLGFDDFAWTLSGDVGAGPASLSSDTMTVVGPDLSCPGFAPGATFYEATAPFAGTVSVSISYSSVDLCQYDWVAFALDGIAAPVAGPTADGCDGFPSPFSFEVAAGQSFGLGVGTADCAEGPGTAVFTSFSFTEEMPSFWVDEGGELDPRLVDAFGNMTLGSEFGATVTLLGDVDGDDVVDYAATIGSNGSTGVFSGATGDDFFGVGGSPGGVTPIVIAAGDLNGNGLDDVVLRAPGIATLIGHEGNGTALHWLWNPPSALFPMSAVRIPDRNADGADEILVAGRDASLQAARIFQLSGSDGSVLLDQMPNTPAGEFGASVSCVGDVTGDGVADILVGVPDTPARADLIDGADGSLIRSLVPPNQPGFPDFGALVAPAGDVTGDGVPDLLVSSPSARDALTNDPDFGAVLLYDGASGHHLQTVQGESGGDFLGARLLGGLDVDGDGSFEMAVSEGVELGLNGSGDSSITLRNTLGGEVLSRFEGGQDEAQFGAGLSALDVGATTSLLAIGAPGQGSSGEVLFFTQLDHPGPPRLIGSGQASPDEDFTITVRNGPPLASAGVVVGLSRLDAPFKGGVLVPNPDKILFITLDVIGEWSVDGTWPSNAPIGLGVWIQTWVADSAAPVGFSATSTLLSSQL